jgi:hypothetical protein
MHNILADPQQNHFDICPNLSITKPIQLSKYFIFSLGNFNFKIIDTFF